MSQELKNWINQNILSGIENHNSALLVRTALLKIVDEINLSFSYELPISTNSILGGVKVGDNLTVTSDGTINGAYNTGNVNDVKNATTTASVWNGKVFSDLLDTKTDKVYPTKLEYAFIDYDGTIKYDRPPIDNLHLVYGVDDNDNPVKAETIEYYYTNNTTTDLTLTQLSVVTAMEVHCPVINSYYKKMGGEWFKFSGTKVV